MLPSTELPARIPEFPAALREYLDELMPPRSGALAALRVRTTRLPFVAEMQGETAIAQLLQFLIRLTGARRVLEVGLFTGCSTLAMAMALPADGTIVAIDHSERWLQIGAEFWQASGHANKIDARIGDATTILDALVAEAGAETFDVAFIDANKDGYDAYLSRCLTLLRSNGIAVFDNVLFGGRVHPNYTAERIRAEESHRPKSMQELYVRYAESLRTFNARIVDDPRLDVAVLPMLDGLILARKRDRAQS